jgi:uncharacterized protein YegL
LVLGNAKQPAKPHHNTGYECAAKAPFKANDWFEWANCHWNMEHPQKCEEGKPKKMMQCRVVCEEYIEPIPDVDPRLRRVCEKKEIDLVFLLDGSGSVKTANFEITKEFVEDVIDHLDVGPTEVSIVQFSDHNTLEILNATDAKMLEHTVENIGYHDGSDTFTGAAIAFTQEQVFKHYSRQNATQVLIVVTDGKAHDDIAVPIADIHAAGITTVAVGVGGYDIDQLEMIASKPEYVHTEADFHQLEDLKKELTEEICRIEKPKTTTTQATTTTRPSLELQCEKAKIDLTFLIDGSGSVSKNNFDLMKTFLFETVQHLDIGVDTTRINMVQYSNRTTTEVTDAQNKILLIESIYNMHYHDGWDTFTGAAITYVQNEIFAKYSRTDAQQMFIVVTDGQSSDDVLAAIAPVHAAGIPTMAIGVGDGVNADEIEAIASEPKYAFAKADFAALIALQEELTETICTFVLPSPQPVPAI